MQELVHRIPHPRIAALALGLVLVGAIGLIGYWLGGLAALITVLAGIALALVGFALWRLPPRQADRAGKITPKERVELENELRKTIAEAIGGLIVIAGLAFTWLQLDASRDDQQLAREEQQTAVAQVATGQAITREQVQAGATQAADDRELARQGQLTDRFTAAVEQLGSEDRAVRLGGIFALERIAHDSADDVEAVMQVLTAYVRERAPWPSQPGVATPAPDLLGQLHPEEDVQAVLTVIERGWWAEQLVNRDGRVTLSTGCLDLRGSDLRGARFRGTSLVPVCLAEADLTRADLTRADLREADLTLAELTEAHLEGADLRGAHLQGADLEGASLDDPDPEDEDQRGADLTGADLSCLTQAFGEYQCTDLEGAHLEGADLQGQDLSCRQQTDGVIECTDLRGAHLEGADLTGANLTGAFLAGADLTGADLSTAVGLTQLQIDAAFFVDEPPQLPEGLHPPGMATPAKESALPRFLSEAEYKRLLATAPLIGLYVDRARWGLEARYEARRVALPTEMAVELATKMGADGHVTWGWCLQAELLVREGDAKTQAKQAVLASLAGWADDFESRDSRRTLVLAGQLGIGRRAVQAFFDADSPELDRIRAFRGFDQEQRLTQTITRIERA